MPLNKNCNPFDFPLLEGLVLPQLVSNYFMLPLIRYCKDMELQLCCATFHMVSYLTNVDW
jgi:hypothetical protein